MFKASESLPEAATDDTRRYPKAPALVMLACFVVVAAGMKAASSILVPFFLAVFIAVVCTPPLFWLRRKGVPKGLALAVILAAILVLGFLFGALTVPALNNFLGSLPGYEEQLSKQLHAVTNWLREKGVSMPEKGVPKIEPGWVMGLAGSILTAFTGVLADAFLILLTVVFILAEAEDFPEKLRAVSKNPEKTLAAVGEFSRSAKQYLVIKTLISAGIGVFIWLWLLILGIDYPVLWGTLSFLLNYVPNIGSIIAALPVALLALLQKGVGSALLAMLGFVIVHVVVGNILEPRWMGKGLALSTLVVFVSLVFWGWILGPIGMILSVPMTSLVKIGLESSDATRGFGRILGSGNGK